MSCDDANGSGISEGDEGPCGAFQQFPHHLPVMCDVDAPTVVIQQTLRLPLLAPIPFSCDVDAPTVLLQETLRFPPPPSVVDLKNPFAETCATCDEPTDEFPAKIPSPQSKPFVSSRRRSSFLVPLDADIKSAGISKRRSSCAFALLPLAACSPEQSMNDSCTQQAECGQDADVEVAQETAATNAAAASPCPVALSLLSPSPCKITSSANKRKTLTAQSPKLATSTPRRHSLNAKSPARLSFLPSTPAILEIPQKVEADFPSVAEQTNPTPLTVPAQCEAAGSVNAAPENCENEDPNLSRKTPEKKKRRLYNPARIPDALLED